MNIYEINEKIKQLLDNLYDVDDETGEIINDRSEELEALEMTRQEKIENTALYYKNMAALAAEIKAEEKSMAERRKRIERKADKLKELVQYGLGAEKMETGRVKISFRKSEGVKVINQDSLPAEYLKTTFTTKPDLAAIKKAIKAGETINGAELEERKNISIK